MNLDPFINRTQEKNLSIQAVMVLQDDTVLGLHRWSEEAARNVYSIAKSHTVTAIGMAIEEGKMSLQDKPVDYFAELLPVVKTLFSPKLYPINAAADKAITSAIIKAKNLIPFDIGL